VTVEISRLSAEQATQFLPNLTEILRDAVNHGASIGFLPPLAEYAAEAYWREVVDALKTPHRILLIARDNEAVTGTVQLNLERRPNGKHRAEVMKLIVHSAHRRQGTAQALMQAVEAEARAANRTTLVLDTRVGDGAERLYLKLGWSAAGVIPRYAAKGDGTIDATVFMYKLLDGK
jgi:ribosomal protein S18 acetylase RimI-like enzyme